MGRRGRVVGLASEPHHEWPRAHGVIPVTYRELERRHTLGKIVLAPY